MLLDHDLSAVYVGVMVLGCLGIGAMALALERRIPADANGATGGEDPVAVTAAETGKPS